jgi:hypothetical protein
VGCRFISFGDNFMHF